MGGYLKPKLSLGFSSYVLTDCVICDSIIPVSNNVLPNSVFREIGRYELVRVNYAHISLGKKMYATLAKIVEVERTRRKSSSSMD